MLNFPTNLVFSRYPQKVRHYVVYSTSQISISVEDAPDFEVEVNLVGKYGDNLYEISVAVPAWFNPDSDLREVFMYIINSESDRLDVNIYQIITDEEYVMDDDVNVIVAPAAGGDIQIYFSAYGSYSNPEDSILNDTSSVVSNWSVVKGAYTDYKYPCLGTGTLEASPDGQQRVCYVAIQNSSRGIIEWLAIVQNAAMTFPVWKDTFASYSTLDDYVEYSLRQGGIPFFKGRAYSLPGSSNAVDINLNRTLEYYLPSNYVPALFYGWQKDTNSKTFDITVGSNTAQEYFTWGDYSYEDSVAEDKPLSHPINGIVDIRQWFVTSFLAYGDNPRIDIENENTTSIWGGNIAPAGNGIYNYCDTLDEEGTYTVYRYGINTGLKYNVTKTCADYCLIYLNKYGGYDTFLVNCTSNGKYQKTDNWQTYQTKKSFRNTTSNFRTSHYLKDITSKWVFHTCWLTDEQASRMDNLLESNRIFLQDLNNQTNIVPVVITDTSLIYKTYSNQGNKLVSYDINVEESQNKIRR